MSVLTEGLVFIDSWEKKIQVLYATCVLLLYIHIL